MKLVYVFRNDLGPRQYKGQITGFMIKGVSLVHIIAARRGYDPFAAIRTRFQFQAMQFDNLLM